MPGYRLTPHTADVGLVAWGDTLEEAFAQAVRAVVAVTFDLRTVRLREEVEVAVEGDRLDRLLVRLLGEVVYQVDARGFVPARAEVRFEPGRLVARLRGRIADRLRPVRAGPVVKAVTHHGLAIEPGPPARVRVLLDI